MSYGIKMLVLSALLVAILTGGYRLLGEPDSEELPVMGRPGDSGEEIVAIQNRLTELGYGVGKAGVLDLATAEGLRQFQEDHGLVATGHANAETVYRLGLTVDQEDLCRYEEQRFLAQTLDAVCPKSTYLCRVALAGVILARREAGGFPNDLGAIVFGEPELSAVWSYDFTVEPSSDAWRAVRDAQNGLSPCPDALYYYRSDSRDPFFRELTPVFRNGTYCFAAPPAE